MQHPFVPSRREWLRLSAAGVVSGAMSGWLPQLATSAGGTTGRAPKSCILLWMNGGPSQHHTFSPPEVGCEYRTIATSVPGVHFTEYLPRLSRLMGDLAILRSMSTPENEHERARSLMHDGYRPVPGETFPSLGSIASARLGQPRSELPNFITIDGGTDGGNGPGFYRPIAAFLGPNHEPLRVQDPDRGVENLRPAMPEASFNDGIDLLQRAEQRFLNARRLAATEAHQAALTQALTLLRSPSARAFDLDREPLAMRQSYGDSKFGRACLLARRLIEADVPFVEVSLAGWDDHGGAAPQVRRRCGYMDIAIARLIEDLKMRGRLESTLIVWMGEFGRSPGRADGHYSRAWTSWLAGGGIRGGRVVGRTDARGGTVTDRPIRANDFMATVCRALGIDHTHHHTTADERPVRIVELGEQIVEEVF